VASTEEIFRADELERLTLLVQASGKLLATLDLDELLPQVFDLAERVLAADAHALWRRNPATDEWALLSVSNLSPEYQEEATEAIRGRGSGVSLEAPIVAEDIATTDWLASAHREAHAREGNRAFVAMPLVHRGEVFGALTFYYRQPLQLSEADMRAASALANLAAAAIGTASSYEAQRRLADERRLVAEASTLLGSSLDVGTTLTNVAQLVVPEFADWCAVDLVGAEGAIERVAVAHVDAEKVRLADELASRYPPDPDAPYGVPSVIRSGTSELIPEISDELLRDATRDTPELYELLVELGLRSSMCVPLVARDRVVGALTFIAAESGRNFEEHDLVTAEELARHAATAVDNALLYREARENERQLRLLAQTSDVLASSLDYDATLQAVARLAVPAFADWCIVDVVEAEQIRRVAVAAADPDQDDALRELQRRFQPTWDSPQPAARALRSGAPVVFEAFDPERLRETVRDEEHYALMERLAPRSAVAVPLVARGDTLGAITFAWSGSGRHYSAADIPFAEDLARRVALVVDNARLHAAERRIGEQLAFLAEASQALASSLDYETTLANVAALIVPRYADWVAVDAFDESGTLRRLAVVHRDPAKAEWAERSRRDFPPIPEEPEGTARVIRTREPALYHQISDELLVTSTHNEEHLDVLRQLGMASAVVVPMPVGGRVLGALQLVSADPDRLYDEEDVAFAAHLGRRAAVAVDNALLYLEAERRAHAAEALAFVGDGVFLVDRGGIVRLWNSAAAHITSRAESEVVGRPAAEVVPGWETLVALVPVAPTPGPGVGRVETLPIDVGGRELWLSFTAVASPGGTVYAFRDLTEERGVEQLKTDFVATVSHELRTPLAAIYGAAVTLRRNDMRLDEPQRVGLLEVIAGESDRLARIVNDILWASRLESDTLQLSIESCDGVELAKSVVEAAQSYVPPDVVLSLSAGEDVPSVAADPDKIRQVLTNLIDNAIKYSPEGGRVAVEVAHLDHKVRFRIADEGLGVPPPEHQRIFEKFYRLDPNLTRGVGGTGLGLYICRELVRRMDGRIWVESDGRRGSTFVVELPTA
jgi:signal transduction histidine kinase